MKFKNFKVMSLDRLGDGKYHKVSNQLTRENAQKWINSLDSDMPETYKIVSETLDTKEFPENEQDYLVRLLKRLQPNLFEESVQN